MKQNHSKSTQYYCIRQRKALQVPTQSFTSANAKLCKCYRKALHLIQSIAVCDYGIADR